MRRLFLFLFVCLAFGACRKQVDGFRVMGTVNKESGKVLLKRMYGGLLGDTLAIAEIKNGKFELTGKVKNLEAAFLDFGIQKKDANDFYYKDGVLLFVDSTSVYNLNVDVENNECEVKCDGKEWLVYQQAVAVNKEFGDRVNELEKQLIASWRSCPEKADSLNALLVPIYAEIQAKEDVIIKANPDAMMSGWLVAKTVAPKTLRGSVWLTDLEFAEMNMLGGKMHLLTLDQLKERYGWLSDRVKASDKGKLIADKIAFRERTEVGQMSADLTLQAPDGTSFKLHEVKGKLKLVDFWASWCKPCRAGNPELVEIYKEFHDKGLEIIGVSLDDSRELWAEAIKKDGLPWIHGSTLEKDGFRSKPAQVYGVGGVPRFYLLDENNRIISNGLRHDELRDKIAELLK
ncbi:MULTISPECIES: TlpA family protein disulfide reductase [Butyricimonas]|uniref:TlpA family protein disulfide reductase n=1 Tax=Butyricimonas TaxID=574697 RepID=UPI0007FB4860|nr:MULTISPECIES: TlpA disulfide reductase family protein [Butyricimonas]